MSTHSAEDRTDEAVLREVLAAVAGRPALSPVHGAAAALLAETETSGGDTGTMPSAVPPGEVPDVDIPHTTRPRIDQPLGDPPTGIPPEGSSLGILDAELVEDSGLDGSIGGGVGAGFTEKGVPTWGSVRDKIDNRSATAVGREELDHSTQAGRTLDDQWKEREAAGKSKLDEIRRSMRDDNPGS